MIYTCIIIDDETVCVTLLRQFIDEHKQLKLVNAFKNAKHALYYLNENPVDIVFLDIYMHEMNGLLVAKKIAANTNIILTTSSKLHSLEAYELGVLDYLLKPIAKERFESAIKRILRLLETQIDNISSTTQKKIKTNVSVIKNRKINNVNTNDIIMIESRHEYICYHTKQGELITLGALKKCTDILDSEKFIRVHKTYIINKSAIATFNSKEVCLSNGMIIPIGRFYKKDAYIKFMN